MTKKNKPIDWGGCEAEYRTGTLSIRALAAKFGCTDAAIRDRAKRYGWSRDLSEQVRKETNARLLRAELRSEDARSDSEIVKDAADVRVELVRQHRSSLGRANAIIAKLLDELESVTDNRSDIEDEIETNTASEKNPRRRDAMLRAVSLPGRAQTARELSQAMKNLIPLERQAFNLDSEVPGAAYDISDHPLTDDEWAARHATAR